MYTINRFVLQEKGKTAEGVWLWRISGGYSLEMMGLVMQSKKPSKHIPNCPSMTDECQYTFATNYFMYQWAGACLPPGGAD